MATFGLVTAPRKVRQAESLGSCIFVFSKGCHSVCSGAVFSLKQRWCIEKVSFLRFLHCFFARAKVPLLIKLLTLTVYCILHSSADNPTAIGQPWHSQINVIFTVYTTQIYLFCIHGFVKVAHANSMWLMSLSSGVTFATNMSRYVFDKIAKIVYENSNAVFTWTRQMNHVPKA